MDKGIADGSEELPEKETAEAGGEEATELEAPSGEAESAKEGKRQGWFRRAKQSVVSEMSEVERKLNAKQEAAEARKAAKKAVSKPTKDERERGDSPFRRPRRNKWSAYVGNFPATRYAVLSLLMLIMVLLNWGYMYLVSYLSVGGIRTNDELLSQLISDGQAFPAKGIGEDGSLVTLDGVAYPPGSYEEVYPLTNRYETPYYDRENLILLAPVDFVSLFKMSTQVFVWFGFTILLQLGERLYTRKSRAGGKYSDMVYGTYPLWLRFMRWAVVILMIMTIGNWLSMLL